MILRLNLITKKKYFSFITNKEISLDIPIVGKTPEKTEYYNKFLDYDKCSIIGVHKTNTAMDLKNLFLVYLILLILVPISIISNIFIGSLAVFVYLLIIVSLFGIAGSLTTRNQVLVVSSRGIVHIDLDDNRSVLYDYNDLNNIEKKKSLVPSINYVRVNHEFGEKTFAVSKADEIINESTVMKI